MEVLKIYCNVTDKEFSVGYTSKVVLLSEKVEFSNYMAREITLQLSKAIETQRFKSKWKPLSPSYKAWKKLNGYSTRIWECTGKLKSSIMYDEFSNRLLVGVDETQFYNNGQNVLEVAKRMEFGSRNTPERPLFRPILLYIRSNIAFFYQKFSREKAMRGGAFLDEIQEHRWSSKLFHEYVSKYNLRGKRR